MTTPYVEPFLATTNAIISSSDTNAANDNHRHWNELLPEPTAAGQLLLSQTAGPGGTSGWATKPSGDTVLGVSSVTGNGPSSAIGPGTVHHNRLVDPGANFVIAGTGAGTSSTKVTPSHLDASNSPSDGQVPVWDATAGKFVFQTPSSVAGVPSGAVVWFETLAELTAAGAGWSRYTAADGRFLIGAGTTFSKTFTEATNYGSYWDLQFSVSGSGTGSTSGSTTGGESAVTNNINLAFGGSEQVTPAHTHTIPSLSVSVGIGGSTNLATFIPPARAGIWGRKA